MWCLDCWLFFWSITIFDNELRHLEPLAKSVPVAWHFALVCKCSTKICTSISIIRFYSVFFLISLPTNLFITYVYRYFLTNIWLQWNNDVHEVRPIPPRGFEVTHRCIRGPIFWLHRTCCTDLLPTTGEMYWATWPQFSISSLSTALFSACSVYGA